MRLAQFVDDVVAQVEATPVDRALLAPEATHGSIFTGGAGVAFFLLETARLRDRSDLLPLARRWLDAARGWGAEGTPEWREHPWGVVLGRGGVPYVELLLCAREGDARGALEAARALDGLSRGDGDSSEEPRPTELLCGAAGVACAMRDVESRLPAGGEHDEARAVVAEVRARETARVLAKHAGPLTLGPGETFGVAHGVAGELWALAMLVGADHGTVRARLDELDAAKELDDEGLVYWPARPGTVTLDLLGSWCNGMAGHALLWTEVARQLGTDRSRDLAARCAESCAMLLHTNPGVCCGVAGHAIALARYAAVSGDPLVERRGYDRLRRAIRDAGKVDGGAWFLSLWQGGIGIALVAMRRLAGERGFPCIEGLDASGSGGAGDATVDGGSGVIRPNTATRSETDEILRWAHDGTGPRPRTQAGTSGI